MSPWKALPRTLLHLVLAYGAVTACMVAYRFVTRALGMTGPSEGDLHATIRRLGSIAAALLGYWVVSRFYERRPITELKFQPLPTVVATISGAFLISITILALFGLGAYRVVEFRGFDKAPAVIGIIFVAATIEEITFRGVLFRILEKQGGTVLALVVQSVVFSVMHVFNSGVTPTTMLSATIVGAFWALLFVATRNLWVCSFNHFAWNTMIFLSGIPLSGQEDWRAAAPFDSTYQGPHWLTGGGFGPEDSILNILLMSLVVAGFAIWAMRRGYFRDMARGDV
jgi:uncharacterized protein